MSGLGGRPFWNSAIIAPAIPGQCLRGRAGIHRHHASKSCRHYHQPQGQQRRSVHTTTHHAGRNADQLLPADRASCSPSSTPTRPMSRRPVICYFGSMGNKVGLVPWIWAAMIFDRGRHDRCSMLPASRGAAQSLNTACILAIVGDLDRERHGTNHSRLRSQLPWAR